MHEKTYKITIFYPEVISALKDKKIDIDAVKASDQETLNTIWKTMVNDGSKRITGLSGQKVKNYNDLAEKSIYFDTNGDLKHRGTTIDVKDRGATLKTFEKALIVDYTYKMADLNYCLLPTIDQVIGALMVELLDTICL